MSARSFSRHDAVLESIRVLREQQNSGDKPGMRVSFGLEEKDLRVGATFAGSAYREALSPGVALLANTLVWACIAIVLLALYDAYGEGQAWPMTVAGAASCAVFIVLCYLTYRKNRLGRAYMSQYRPFPINQSVTLTDAGVEFESRSMETRFPWSAVTSVHDTPQHIVIVIRPFSALPIPKSAFDDDQVAKAFLAQAASRIASQGDA